MCCTLAAICPQRPPGLPPCSWICWAAWSCQQYASCQELTEGTSLLRERKCFKQCQDEQAVLLLQAETDRGSTAAASQGARVSRFRSPERPSIWQIFCASSVTAPCLPGRTRRYAAGRTHIQVSSRTCAVLHLQSSSSSAVAKTRSAEHWVPSDCEHVRFCSSSQRGSQHSSVLRCHAPV